MDMAIDFPVDHSGPLNAPSEIFERINDVHPKMDGSIDQKRDLGTGWDFFPGLLPA